MTPPPRSALSPDRPAVFAVVAILVVAVFHLQLVAAGLAPGVPSDPDGWARLLRVRELWETGAWYPPLLPYLAAPEGLSLHWTRPLDLIVLGGAWIGVHVLALPPDAAMVLAGALACPLLHAATAIAVGLAARRVWPDMPLAPYFALLALLGNGVLNAYAVFGRTDHHVLISCLAAIGFGAALRAAGQPERARAALAAGLGFGAGIWVGPEAMLVAVPAAAAFGLLWALGRDGAAMARQGLRLALGMAATIAVAILLERPPAAWLATEYDRVSAHHLVLALLIAGVFAGARLGAALPRAARLALGAALGGGALALLLALYPGTMDSALTSASWLPDILEMQPVPVTDPRRLGETLGLVGIVPAALLGLLALPWDRARSARVAHAAMLVTVFAATLVAALAHRRFGAMLIIPGAVAAAGLTGTLARLPGTPLLRLPAMLLSVALLAPGVFAALLPGQDSAPDAAGGSASCAPEVLAAPLSAAILASGVRPEEAIVLSSDFNHGPAIAWQSRLRFVAAPYHRGDAAVADANGFFRAPDPAMAEAIAARRRAGFVLLCQGDFETGAPFAALLRFGPLPGWLEPVPLALDRGPAPRLWRRRGAAG